MKLFLSTWTISIVIAITLSPVHSTKALDQLGDYIKDFSPLYYDTIELHKRHLVSKRSLYGKSVSLQIHHNGRKLDLLLHPADDGIFNEDAVISQDGIDSKFDNSHLYNGFIRDDPESSITGSIIDGVFQGMISTGSGEVFYVERKQYHPSHPKTNHDQVHSVIYNKEDVDVDKFNEFRRVKRGAKQGLCGLKDERIAKEMDRIENSMVKEKSRSKRATTPTNHVCNMYLQSDPEMWRYMATLHSSDTMIVQEISALFRELVKEVNGIYKTTDFSGQTGYQLRVDRLTINKTCTGGVNHWFCDQDLDVSNFLNLNTYTNHDKYCLAYILTYRDFADGTLGLAWVAKPGSLAGGICSKYTTYSENGSPREKSLNTGIVTIKNYGQRVPKLMSQLTLAHEVGHNFGSNHDPNGDSRKCTPYTDSDDEAGNYIMFYAAISGKRANNIKFSPCSTSEIGAVLKNSRNTACFKSSTDGHCGNQILDGKEDCDCGYETDCKGVANCCKCCHWQNEQDNANQACTLRTTPDSSGSGSVVCDPSQGPCCRSSCGFEPNTVECNPATECSNASFCGGNNASCPAPDSSAFEGNLCNSKTQVCKSGACTESVCTKIGSGWKECSLSSTEASGDQLCLISCSDGNKCYSSADSSMPPAFKNILNIYNSGNKISVRPGYPCDKDQGFCDYFLTCRKINELGPLARLKGLLLSLTSVEGLTAWLSQYWWVVLLAVAGLIVITVLLVKFGAVFTPSSNPDKKPNRSIRKPLTKPQPRRRSEGPGVRDREIEMSRR